MTGRSQIGLLRGCGFVSGATQPGKSVAVNQLERSPDRELHCLPRESSRRNQDAPIRAFSGHDPEELADALHRHLAVLPVLALDDDPLAAAGKLEINSAIRLRSTALDDGIALPTVGFPDKQLKISPVELADGLEAVRTR